MTRPRFLLDVDGPLTTSFVEEACRMLRQHPEFVDKAHPHNIPTWDIMKALGVPKDLENATYDRLKLPGVAFDFTPNKGSEAFVKAIEEDFDVYIVTSPLGGPHWEDDRRRWLAKHYNIPAKRVLSAHAKYLVRGDFFLDDKYAHIETWSKENPQGVGILWETLHNQDQYWRQFASTYTHVLDIVYQWKRVHG